MTATHIVAMVLAGVALAFVFFVWSVWMFTLGMNTQNTIDRAPAPTRVDGASNDVSVSVAWKDRPQLAGVTGTLTIPPVNSDQRPVDNPTKGKACDCYLCQRVTTGRKP